MSDAKHTPGQWETHWSHDVTGYPAFYIHGLSGEQKYDAPALDANARLISAAPEMLAALERVGCQFLGGCDPSDDGGRCCVCAAIAKARGEP